MQDITYLLYTHTEYDDIFQIHIKKLVEFFPSINYAICIDNTNLFVEKYASIYKPIQVYQYDTNAPYAERLRSVISQIKTPYLILGHEKNVLTGPVNNNIMIDLLNIMREKNIDQLRLMVSGIPYPVFDNNIIHKITEGYFMSIVPAIWKVNSLLNILNKYSHLSYKQFELDDVQNETKKLNNYYISTPHDSLFSKGGIALSYIYPVIHLTFRGKWWCTNNHKPFIEKFLTEFNIDINTRGAYYEDDFANTDNIYKDVVLLIHSHTDFIDILIPALYRIKKNWKNISICLCVNDISAIKEKLSDDLEIKYMHQYSEGDAFLGRFLHPLQTIKESHIIFNLEVNVLIDPVNESFFKEIFTTMKTNNIDQIRLMPCGIEKRFLEQKEINPIENLLTVDDFSFGTTLWKKTAFIDLCSKFKDKSYRFIESDDVNQYIKESFKSYAINTKDTYKIMAFGHNYCPAFPFVHMTKKGKWRLFGEFQQTAILNFCNEFNLDVFDRGVSED